MHVTWPWEPMMLSLLHTLNKCTKPTNSDEVMTPYAKWVLEINDLWKCKSCESGSEWSTMLLGHGSTFLCLSYQHHTCICSTNNSTPSSQGTQNAKIHEGARTTSMVLALFSKLNSWISSLEEIKVDLKNPQVWQFGAFIKDQMQIQDYKARLDRSLQLFNVIAPSLSFFASLWCWPRPMVSYIAR